ncbi:SagB/ThcOx family dehydrogenase [Pyrococcus kukulkanii]|uniref:SagB/ThcOx family dehydrogenase n=1 Tax=Pyrococcus kukulkanii TaxID=1609559 RepID=UPI0035684031
MKKLAWFTVFLVIVGSLAVLLKPYLPRERGETTMMGEVIKLPEPRLTGEMSVEEAIAKRRSIRRYRNESLTLQELSQLLWAAQGITEPNRKFRAAPSAGATYPFEVYVVVGKVKDLEPGIYHYDPFSHSIKLIKRGDFRRALQKAALNQAWVGSAAIDIVLVAYYERTTKYYGERGRMYVHMEAGHIGQNIYLQATALNLGTVAVGAFYEDQVAEILGVDGVPLYIFPVGKI